MELSPRVKLNYNLLLGIFTVDVDFSKTKIEEGSDVKRNVDEENTIEQKFEDHLNREKRKNLKADVLEEEYFAWEEFIYQDEEFNEAHKKFTEEFYEAYTKGFEAYVKGSWTLARMMLEQANVRI